MNILKKIGQIFAYILALASFGFFVYTASDTITRDGRLTEYSFLFGSNYLIYFFVQYGLCFIFAGLVIVQFILFLLKKSDKKIFKVFNIIISSGLLFVSVLSYISLTKRVISYGSIIDSNLIDLLVSLVPALISMYFLMENSNQGPLYNNQLIATVISGCIAGISIIAAAFLSFAIGFKVAQFPIILLFVSLFAPSLIIFIMSVMSKCSKKLLTKTLLCVGIANVVHTLVVGFITYRLLVQRNRNIFSDYITIFAVAAGVCLLIAVLAIVLFIFIRKQKDQIDDEPKSIEGEHYNSASLN